SQILKIMRSLNHRMELTQKQKNYYAYLEKGLEGERRFDTLIASLTIPNLYLQDILLKCNGTYFQIDALMITKNVMYLFEIKNYEGEYMLDGTSLINCTSKKEVLNPTLQLDRSKTLLKQLLNEQNLDIDLKAYVVFINQEFTLYQSSQNEKFLLPGRIKRFLKELDKENGRLSAAQYYCSDTLCKQNLIENPFADLPNYSYETIKKGLLCQKCFSEITRLTGRMVKCSNCQHSESTQATVLGHINEFALLFPEKELTTSAIYEWCSNTPSIYTIRLVLKRNFQVKNLGKIKVYG
ncbi:MAG: nuclease-related domain-containing protein, partial [Alkalibacterium sp.]